MSVAPVDLSENPSAAYVHVPFCAHRCGYCNFALVAHRPDLIEEYLKAIRIELSWLRTSRIIDSLFLGGGTPTQLAPDQLRRLCDELSHWFSFREPFEFTCEANPADVNVEIGEQLAKVGVNRISLGAQSFDSAKLACLERDHGRSDIERAFRLASKFTDNTSIDLIFGVPGESLQTWKSDLQTAICLSPSHISTYGLTFERGTIFWNRRHKGELEETGEELLREMYVLAIDMLSQAGYEHYEVSSFARPGKRCRHNQVYWTGRGYYGFGPGAARFVAGCREVNHRSTTTYLKRVLAGDSATAESERLCLEERARERLVLGLRMLEGVDSLMFAQETGFEISDLAGSRIEKLLDLAMLKRQGKRIQLTRKGLLVSDSICSELLKPD